MGKENEQNTIEEPPRKKQKRHRARPTQRKHESSSPQPTRSRHSVAILQDNTNTLSPVSNELSQSDNCTSINERRRSLRSYKSNPSDSKTGSSLSNTNATVASNPTVNDENTRLSGGMNDSASNPTVDDENTCLSGSSLQNTNVTVASNPTVDDSNTTDIDLGSESDGAYVDEFDSDDEYVDPWNSIFFDNPELKWYILTDEIKTTLNSLSLGHREWNLLANIGAMLIDTHIDAAHILLSRRFPNGGCQRSGLGQNHTFKRINVDENGMQILHCGSLNHWVTTAMPRWDLDGVVQLIDSAYCGKPTDSLKISIALVSKRLCHCRL
eukprot:946838_1